VLKQNVCNGELRDGEGNKEIVHFPHSLFYREDLQYALNIDIYINNFCFTRPYFEGGALCRPAPPPSKIVEKDLAPAYGTAIVTTSTIDRLLKIIYCYTPLVSWFKV